MHKPGLGVDFGGVINDGRSTTEDTSFFSDNFLLTPHSQGVFETLRSLSSPDYFGSNIWIISKCGARIQARTEQWLAHHNFYERSGIDPSHALFTPTRIGKVALAEPLNLTHFVDDRLEILGYMTGIIPNRYLFNPDEDEVTKHNGYLAGVTVVDDWAELGSLLQTSLE